jgi:hypothetical protein
VIIMTQEYGAIHRWIHTYSYHIAFWRPQPAHRVEDY